MNKEESNNSKKHFRQKSAADMEETNRFFMESQRGNPVLVINMFKFKKGRRNKGDIIAWICAEVTCRALCHTKGETLDVIDIDLIKHNHPADARKISRQVISAGVKKKGSQNVSTKPGNLISSELNCSPLLASNLQKQDVNCIRRNLENARAKKKSPLSQSVEAVCTRSKFAVMSSSDSDCPPTEIIPAMDCDVQVKTEPEVEVVVEESIEPSEKKIKIEDNTESNGKTRQRRNLKSKPAYDLDLVDSDSEPEQAEPEDPEFKPSYTRPSVSPSSLPPTQLTGFTLFCFESRANVQRDHPDLTPAKLNMKLANMWSDLPAGTKRSYSCRARHIDMGFGKTKVRAKEIRKSVAADVGEIDESVSVAFCCSWDRCDFQYEVVDECAQHITDEHLKNLCHPGTELLRVPSSCHWRGCLRRKRCFLPFVQFERLSRHMSEEHVLVGKTLKSNERSEHYIPRPSV